MVNISEIPRPGVQIPWALKACSSRTVLVPPLFLFHEGNGMKQKFLFVCFCSCIHSSVIIKISWNTRESFLKWQMNHFNLIRSTKCRKTHDLHKHLIFAFMMADSFSKTCYLHHCQVKLHDCTFETFLLHHASTYK